MKLRRSFVRAIVLAAATAVMLVPTAANAGVGVEAGAGAASTTARSGEHVYDATITVEVAPAAGGTTVVTWVCQAEALPDAVSTTISQCSVNGVSAPPVTLPGPVAATAGAAVFPVGVGLLACISGFAAFAEATTGGQLVVAPERCAGAITAAI